MFDRLTVREKPADKALEPGEMYSPNTIRIYQSALNQMAKATDVDTVEKLRQSKNQKKAVAYVDKLTGNNHKHRVVYSAMFYALEAKTKQEIKVLFDGFQKYKIPDGS
jgi:uncharacterized protein (DUF1697 family)